MDGIGRRLGLVVSGAAVVTLLLAGSARGASERARGAGRPGGLPACLALVAELEAEVTALDAGLAECDAELVAALDAGGEKDAQIASLTAALAARDEEIADLWAAVAAQGETISGLEAGL